MITTLFNKKNFFLFAKLTLSIAVLWFLVHTAQIKVELFVNLFHQPALFTLLAGVFCLLTIIASWRWYELNTAQGIRLGYLRTTMATYIGTAFNNLLPGAIGGDFIRCYYLFKRIPDKKSSALITIFFDRFLGFMGIIITIFFVAMANMTFFYEHHLLFYLLFICGAFCVSTLGLLFIFMVLPHRTGLTKWLNHRFPHKPWIKTISSFLDALRHYRIPKMVIFKCLAASVVLQLLFASAALIIAKMMGLPAISLSDYAIAVGVTLIVNLIPATPGGIGIGEMAFANMLLLLNPGTSAAYATIFLSLRLVSILFYLPGVIFCIPRFLLLRKKNSELLTTA